MTEMKVDPYNVEGEIDYDRLISEFGLKKIDGKLLKRIEEITGEIHPYFRRGIFFSYS
jgi:tryptophanyl-tRNA synthetase